MAKMKQLGLAVPDDLYEHLKNYAAYLSMSSKEPVTMQEACRAILSKATNFGEAHYEIVIRSNLSKG